MHAGVLMQAVTKLVGASLTCFTEADMLAFEFAVVPIVISLASTVHESVACLRSVIEIPLVHEALAGARVGGLLAPLRGEADVSRCRRFGRGRGCRRLRRLHYPVLSLQEWRQCICKGSQPLYPSSSGGLLRRRDILTGFSQTRVLTLVPRVESIIVPATTAEHEYLALLGSFIKKPFVHVALTRSAVEALLAATLYWNVSRSSLGRRYIISTFPGIR